MSFTVKDLSSLFHRSDFTIRRWVQEEREIVFDGFIYIAERDPGGNLLFKKVKLIEHRIATHSNVK